MIEGRGVPGPRGVVGARLAILVAAAAWASAPAAIPDSDILADSVLELTEVAADGSYQTLTVTLTTREGRATLVAVKDGVEARVEAKAQQVLPLWKAILAQGAEELGDASPARVPPDTSRFTISLRTPGASHAFAVRAVDDLDDPRYRAIVREILHWTDSRAYGAAWRK